MALIQSLVRKGVVDDVVGQYGNLIIDECHHLPAQSFEQVTRQAKAKYISGLTATLRRKDGHHPIITMDRNGLTKAGRALQKHSSRPNGIFPKTCSKATDFNKHGQFHLDDILTDPKNTF